MSDSPPSARPQRRRAPIALADAPLADYRPQPEQERDGRAARSERAPDPRLEPVRLAAEATQSVNFHVPRSLDRALSRLKFELEAEYGVRTSKTALAAAALYALPREPLAALAALRAYEAAELPLDQPAAGR
jgi:hypothetical protein